MRIHFFPKQIVALELLTASGEILEISGDKNPDLLPAARCSLGSLGIILNVTIQCEPAFRLHQKTYPSKLDDVSCSPKSEVGFCMIQYLEASFSSNFLEILC